MTDHKQAAREIINAAFDHPEDTMDGLHDAIAAALARVERETRERTIETATDLWYLAALLHDDDSFYGDNRNAPARLEAAGNALGWTDDMLATFRDVTGREPAIRALAEEDGK